MRSSVRVNFFLPELLTISENSSMMRYGSHILISVLICCVTGMGIVYADDWSFIGVTDTHGGNGLLAMDVIQPDKPSTVLSYPRR
jgi:hypothetical protein